MSPHTLSISALVAMFVVATVLPVNMGVLAFVGAFLVGTLVAGVNAKAILGFFPADLFLTLVGITYLFAIAQNNGTIDLLVRQSVRAVGGRVAAIPWVILIAAVLTSVGAVSPAAVAIIAPIALGFAAKYAISPLLMGLLVVHGACWGPQFLGVERNWGSPLLKSLERRERGRAQVRESCLEVLLEPTLEHFDPRLQQVMGSHD